MEAYLNATGTALPAHERHGEFLNSLPHWIHPEETAEKVRKIALNAAIDQRFTVLPHPLGPAGSGAFFEYGAFPSTGQRMVVYQREAPRLAAQAVAALAGQTSGGLEGVTHLLITTCTGFYAPGLDIDLVKAFGLSPSVKRTVVGFMGCYAALSTLRMAREIVRGEPGARVLMVNVELCSLHLQQTPHFDRLVSYCLFADGAAASLISADATGLRLDNCYSALSLEDADRMAWVVEDQGFAMTLDARVPAKIRQFIRQNPQSTGSCATDPDKAIWAVHPGGRLILDAVQSAFSLTDEQMAVSRSVLRDFGNMSSATIMFALQRLLASPAPAGTPGHALAFGPGLTLEGVDFTVV